MKINNINKLHLNINYKYLHIAKKKNYRPVCCKKFGKTFKLY